MDEAHNNGKGEMERRTVLVEVDVCLDVRVVADNGPECSEEPVGLRGQNVRETAKVDGKC
jgi:hypothetical protein